MQALSGAPPWVPSQTSETKSRFFTDSHTSRASEAKGPPFLCSSQASPLCVSVSLRHGGIITKTLIPCDIYGGDNSNEMFPNFLLPSPTKEELSSGAMVLLRAMERSRNEEISLKKGVEGSKRRTEGMWRRKESVVKKWKDGVRGKKRSHWVMWDLANHVA